MNRQERAEFWSRAARAPGECLQPEELEALLEGRGDVRQQSHLESCPACAAEMRLFSEFVSGEPRPEEVAAVDAIAAKLRSPVPGPETKPLAHARGSARGSRFWVPSWAIGLATVALVAGLAYQTRLWRDPSLHVDSNESAVVRSGGLRILAPAGELPVAPQEIAWDAAPGAQRYRVRLMEVDGTVVWSTETETWRIALPEGARSFFVPLKTLRIEVEALDAGGRIVGSGASRVVVKPGAGTTQPRQ